MTHTVLSGIRATGNLHLGNYLGAVKGMLALQADPNFQTLYMVADVHAITTPYDVENLRKYRKSVVLDYLSVGLDPEKSIIFLQADVSAHLELAFYLSSVQSIARMQHLPTFKEKVKQYPDKATMALLNYPILMAADILIYKAESVPVGLDQEPHLEIAREIARKMNLDYGMDFPEPKRFVTKGSYVPSLLGEGKMSKSVEGSYINLTDDLATIRKRIAKVPTDSGKGDFSLAPKGVAVLFELVEAFISEERKKQLIEMYQNEGVRYGDIKEELSLAIYKELEPIQARRKDLDANPEYVEQVIREGAIKARAIAEKTVLEVKTKMGLA